MFASYLNSGFIIVGEPLTSTTDVLVSVCLQAAFRPKPADPGQGEIFLQKGTGLQGKVNRKNLHLSTGFPLCLLSWTVAIQAHKSTTAAQTWGQLILSIAEDCSAPWTSLLWSWTQPHPYGGWWEKILRSEEKWVQNNPHTRERMALKMKTLLCLCRKWGL